MNTLEQVTEMDFQLGVVDEDAPFCFPEWIGLQEMRTALDSSPVKNNWRSVSAGKHILDDSLKGATPVNRLPMESVTIGKAAEDAFASRFEGAIGRVQWIPTTVWDDYKRRIDCMCLIRESDNDILLPIDIKAVRALRRNGKFQNKYMFVELHPGGSLFAGDSTVVAQSLDVDNQNFVLLSKSKLRDYVKSKFDTSQPPVYFPEQSLFRGYRRAGKAKEWIGLIPMLEAVQHAGIAIV